MTHEVDIAVVGAGPAGIAAGRRLAAAGASFLILEARDRPGGRTLTVVCEDHALDVGAGWLHSADESPLPALAEAAGVALDRTPPPWSAAARDRPMLEVDLSRAERADFRAAFTAFEARVEAAAAEPGDRPAADLFDPDCCWNARMDAVSGALNGVRFAEVSARDYAGYVDTGVDWRAIQGLGALIAGLGAGLPVVFGRPVRRIDRSGARLTLQTPAGDLTARAVIVTVPTALIADGTLRLDPAPDALLEAAEGLPLGLALKHHMAVTGAEDFPPESHIRGRADSADTGGYHLRPFGRPLIEAYFGGDIARQLEAEGPGAAHAFAEEELVSLLGSGMRRRLRPLSTSAWGEDPWSRGAFSYARPGRAGDRARLRTPVEDRLFLAGEATCARFYGTAHGAWLEGERAAGLALEAIAA